MKSINHIRLYRLLHAAGAAHRTRIGMKWAERLFSISRKIERMRANALLTNILFEANKLARQERMMKKRGALRAAYRERMMKRSA